MEKKMHFTDELIAGVKKKSPIVVGIDPNFDLMPSFLQPTSSSDVYDKLFEFSKIVIEKTRDLVPAVKPQSAYFEQFGLEGIRALRDSIRLAKDNGLLVILDVKRGDIGSTSLAYAKAYLSGETSLKVGHSLSSDLEVDCITINPFLGEDSLQPFVDTAVTSGKGLFILVKTSNVGSKMLMDISHQGEPVSRLLARKVNDFSLSNKGDSGYALVGAVIGATAIEDAKELRKLMPHSLFLIPGMGAQGGDLETVLSLFNQDGLGAIIPISRGITYSKDLSEDPEAYGNGVRQRTETFITMIQEGLDQAYNVNFNTSKLGQSRES